MGPTRFSATAALVLTLVAVTSCSANPSGQTTGSEQTQGADGGGETLTKDESCAELNNIVLSSQNERGITDHRPFIADEVRKLSEKADPSLTRDLQTLADTANEPGDVGPANEADANLDEACKITEFLTAAAPPPSTAGSESSSGQATPGVDSTAAPAVFEFSGVASVEDEEGYTFDVSYDYKASKVTSDPADELPGFTTARIGGRTNLEVINTTMGRNLSFPYVSGVTYPQSASTVTLVLAWRADSPLCQAMDVDSDVEVCSVRAAFGRLPDEIGVDQSVTLETFAGTKGEYGWTAGIKGLPEEQYEELAEYIAAPDEVRIYIAADRLGRFSSADCSLGALVFPEGVVDCDYDQLPQPLALS